MTKLDKKLFARALKATQGLYLDPKRHVARAGGWYDGYIAAQRARAKTKKTKGKR